MRRRDALDPVIEALRTTLSDRDLARLVASWFATSAGKWAFLVTNLVIAYQLGGPVAVGILGLARYIPPTIVAPLAGLPTVRWAPDAVLVATSAMRALCVAAAIGVVALGAPLPLLFAAVALEAGVGAFTRPLTMALLPCVARTPAQLVAANVATMGAEGLGTFVGPAIAGVLLATIGPTGSLFAVLAIYALGVAAIANLRVQVVGRSDASLAAVRRQVTAGVHAVMTVPGPRLVVSGLGLQTVVRGLLTVLTVVAAVELLGMGEPGVGAMHAAMGAGGVVGALLAITLTGRRQLGPVFTVALAAWGAPIVVIGLVAAPIAALGALVAIGVSNAILDVAGYTVIQRTTPNQSRVAVMGLLDSVANAGVALGGIIAPVLLAAFGIQGALVATGFILPITAVVLWPAMRHLDDSVVVDERQADLLRGVPLFAPLSLATIEHLASELTPVEFADGAWLMREGEAGDRYYLVASGELEVTRTGSHRARVGAGEGVGEIALLDAVPRTASVRAIGQVQAYALERDAFLEAVTGHAVSYRAARTVADGYLASMAEGTA